jgi:hypothetical protein
MEMMWLPGKSAGEEIGRALGDAAAIFGSTNDGADPTAAAAAVFFP